MQRKYLAVDLRGYPSDLYEMVCQVTLLQKFSTCKDRLQGVEIDKPHQLKRLPKHVVVFARGGTVQKNRKFLNSKRVHVLSRPYPFDSVQARLAAEHTIAVELCLKDVETTFGYMRARILTHLQATIRLAKRYHACLVITSGASCAAEVKSPRQLVAFGKVLGLDYPEAKAAIYNIPKIVLEGVK
jgi:RNase P/RNase MRP subunit p30